MRFVDIFAGIGGFRQGLVQAGHTAVGHIELDKFACKSYETMYDLCPCKFADTSKNSYMMCKKEAIKQCKEEKNGEQCSIGVEREWFGKDIKAVTSGEIPEAEIWTFGFPCTDVSISNNQKRGLDGTRSGLFFNVIGLLQGRSPEDRPQWIVAENVKNLLSIKGGRDFASILTEISELGYDIQWCLVNSKNFGVPQNRERVYIIGHLRGKCGGEIFPIGGTNTATLVQEVSGLQGERVYNSEGLSVTLTANSGGFGGKCGLYRVNSSEYHGYYKEDEMISPCSFIDLNENPKLTEYARTICARQKSDITNHKGERSGIVICHGHPDCIRAVITPDRLDKRQNGRRFKDIGEPSFTLTCQDHHGVMLCCCLNNTDSCVQKGETNCESKCDMGETTRKVCCRIRRLTPKECFRLQGFPDELFDKLKAVGISDAQLYRQAGNAVTVNVVYEIGKKLKSIEDQPELEKIMELKKEVEFEV